MSAAKRTLGSTHPLPTIGVAPPSFQLVNATDGGASCKWSSIQLQDSFSSGQSPMPIVTAGGRAPRDLLFPTNTTIYEFNPFEMGSWDSTTYAFVPTESLGSSFSGGTMGPKGPCVRGFDNVGFVMGTSSSIFNQSLLHVDQMHLSAPARSFFNYVFQSFDKYGEDIAIYSPNPFCGFNNRTFLIANTSTLNACRLR